jgi:hypothetical protein
MEERGVEVYGIVVAPALFMEMNHVPAPEVTQRSIQTVR